MPSGTPSRRLPGPANGGGAQTRLLPFRPSWGGCLRGTGRTRGVFRAADPGLWDSEGERLFLSTVGANEVQGGREGVLAPGKSGLGIAPFPLPPKPPTIAEAPGRGQNARD